MNGQPGRPVKVVPATPSLLPLAMALFCIIVWGLSYAVIRAAVREIPPMSLAFARFVLASALLWPLVRRQWRPVARQDRLPLLALGLTGVTVYFAFENFGLKYTTASHAALIIATIPLCTELVAALRRRESLAWQTVAASCVALAGVFVLVGPGQDAQASLLGDLLMFGAVASWVCYSFLVEKTSGRYPNLQVTQIIMLIGLLTFLPGAAAEMVLSPYPWPSAAAWGGVVFLGVLCSALGYHFWNQAIPALGVTVACNLLYALPLVGVAGGVVLLGERLTPGIGFGAALIIGGVVWAHQSSRRKAVQR
jgi:drug/metabolite transporter (DMT)-like permease